MKINNFEDLCKRACVLPVKRIEHKNGIILIGDGATAQGDEGAYRTIWAFGRNDENIEVGRTLSFNFFYEDNGIHRPTTQEIRVAAAVQDAMEHAEERNG